MTPGESTGPVIDPVVDLVELRRHTGTRRAVAGRFVVDDAVVGDREVVGGAVEIDLVVEAVTEGVCVTGDVRFAGRGPCRRCLRPVDVDVDVAVQEIFEADPTEGETWPIDDERIDLAPMVREAALLSLPLAPLCADDCAGPEPERFPTRAPDGDEAEPPRDERWAALDELEFD